MLDAASLVFGERGYAGTTTDAVADAAAVSQAYVVRTFGSKEALFAETATRAVDRIAAVFRQAAEPDGGADPDADGDADADDTVQARLGKAYVDLVADRGILLTVMHLFTLGHHPRFGPLARESMLRIFRVLRDEVQLSNEETEAFLAKGMLINTVLGLRLPDIADTEPDARELLGCILVDAADHVVTLATEHPPLPATARGAD